MMFEVAELRAQLLNHTPLLNEFELALVEL
jgi:hypothetical protein